MITGLSRRGILGGAARVAAAGAALTAVATVPALARSVSPAADPIIDLWDRLQLARAEIARWETAYNVAIEKLPSWAQPGETCKRGGIVGHPELAENVLLRLWGRPILNRRPCELGERRRMQEVEEAHRLGLTSIVESQERLDRFRARFEARIQAIQARRREQEDLEKAVGLDAANDELEAAQDVAFAIEREIVATPATTARGVALKLRFLAGEMADDDWALDVLAGITADVERLAREGGR